MRSLAKITLGVIFVMSIALCAQAQSIQIRTQDSVGLNPAAPMLAQFSPPPIYFKWMVAIAQCEHLALPPLDEFKKSRFFEVNADDFQINSDTTQSYFAITQSDGSGHADFYFSIVKYLDFRIVMHEFLHNLLHYNFNDSAKDHPAKYFGTCGVKPN